MAEHDVEHDENVSGEEEDWSDEGDALVEGEEDTPHLARVAKPASSRARARPEPRPTPPALRSASVARRGGGTAAIAANVAEDLDSVFAELGAGVGDVKVTVTRLEPMTDERTGQRIAGLLDSFQRPITLEELKHRFGGGRYNVLVMGPKKDGRGSEFKYRKVIEIAGPPKLPKGDDEEKKPEIDIIKTFAEREERERERAEKQLEAMRAEIREQNNLILQLVAKAGDKPKDDSTRLMIEAMREESRRREEQYREEIRRREEQDRADRAERERRWQEEREEQRRRDEEAKRQHEAEMKRQEAQMALKMKELELQQQLTAERLKEETRAQKEWLSHLMSFMQKNDGDKEVRAQQMMQLQVENLKQSSEMQVRFMEQQMKFLVEQTKNKDDFFAGLEKFQALKDLLDGFGGDTSTPFERGVEKVTEAVQGLLPGLSMLATNRSSPPTATQQPTQRRIAPGSVAVVDEYEDDEDAHAELPPAQQPAHQPEAPQEAGPVTENDDVIDAANPLKEFASYEGQTDNQVIFTLLVQNLDLAIQRDLSVEDIYTVCLKDLPAAQKAPLRMAPASMILGYVEQYVPPSWRIRAVDAEEKLRAVIEYAKKHD